MSCFRFAAIGLSFVLLGTSATAGLVATNLPYSTAHPALIFDWYAPDVPTRGATPLAVFMHGAQGTNGSKNDVNAGGNKLIKEHLLRNGFSVMSIEYRPYPDFIYPAQIQDAAMALQHFKHNASTYSIDPTRVLVWGLSGGAIIGGKLCYGLDWANPNGTPEQQISTRPLAFINLSGLTNFKLMSPYWPGAFFGKQFLIDVDPLVLDEASFSENVLDVSRSFTPAVASCYGTVENPPPLNDPHDVTLMKDLHGKLAAGFPLVAERSIQLTKVLGAALDDFEHLAEWAKHQANLHSALDLGFAKPGTAGIAPRLSIEGTFDPGTPFTVKFESSTGVAAPIVVLIGQSSSPSPGLGGTIVPAISGAIPLAVDASGSLTISSSMDSGTPLGIVTYLQFLQSDAGAPGGVAISNAVRVTTGI